MALDDLLSQFKTDIIEIPKTIPSACVYFLIQDGEIVYVGQSIQPLARIGIHIHQGLKIFNEVRFIQIDAKELNEYETFFIMAFAPKYNKSVPGGDYLKVNAIAKSYGYEMKIYGKSARQVRYVKANAA